LDLISYEYASRLFLSSFHSNMPSSWIFRAVSASVNCFLVAGLRANDEVENLIFEKFFFYLCLISKVCSGCFTSSYFCSSAGFSSAGFSPSAGASPSAGLLSPSLAASALGSAGLGTGVIGDALTGIFSSSVHS
jgi:hypothetical protein